MSAFARALGFAGALTLLPMAASAAVVTAGPGGFDNGWATTITYEDDNAAALRGTSFNRDNPLNALGASDGDFFEIGLGSDIELTFGTLFDTTATIFEITFGNIQNFPEQVLVEVGLGGSFVQVGGPVSNVAAQGGVMIGLGVGTFDTIRLIDDTPALLSQLNLPSPATGGFDVDAVRVQPVDPVPLPAAGFLLIGGLGAVAALRRRKG